MLQKKKYCLQCFLIIAAEVEVCPQCAYPQPENHNPLYLKPPFRLQQQYFIGKVLGHGGFAITYLGHDRHLNVQVAIKEYFPSEFATRSTDGQTVIPFEGEKAEFFKLGKDKFIAEARLLASLRNPNIIRIRHFFEANNTAYFIMEYLEGETLSQYVERRGGRLPIKEARDKLLLPLLGALEEVHDNHTFHRDIKPDNIYITKRGEPILLDFGAARQQMSGKTTNLLAFITPGFAPAEQYTTNGIQGPWTDIYALSATIYRTLTGLTPPIPQDRMLGEEELIRPSQLGVAIDEWDENWLLQGLQIKWSQRPENVVAWRKLIEPPEEEAVAPPDPQKVVEENFIRMVILPKLASRLLVPADEHEIHASASFMHIPSERITALIDETLAMTGSERHDPVILPESNARQDALSRREEELAHKEDLLRRLSAEEEEDRRRMEDLRRRESEADKLRLEELARKEEALKRKEEALELTTELARKEEELRRKEDFLRRAEALQLRMESPPPAATPKIESPTVDESEEIDLDAYSDDLLDILNPHKRKTPPTVSINPLSPLTQPFSWERPPKPRLSNHLGMEFILVMPFMLGESLGFIYHPTLPFGESGEASIALMKPYYLQVTPVTQAQWQQLMGENPSHFQGDRQRPVERVSWDDCQQFIQRLSATGEGHYRLPTEAEWEYACRAGSSQPYCFGSQEQLLTQYAWYADNAGDETRTVGLKNPNAWGFYDLHGNVWEWVSDRFAPLPSGLHISPQGPEAGAERVMRGGSWSQRAGQCHSGTRAHESPGHHARNVGFRLLLELG